MINYRDQTPPSTPERVRDAARRDDHERRQRVMESPQNRRVPEPFPVNNDLLDRQFNYPRPADLQQMVANLPPLNPVGQRRRGRQVPVDPALALGPPFAPAPAPAPAQYRYINADLAQQVAALPPLQQRGRGRGRGRRGDNPAPAPAPVAFGDLANQVAALPPVCFFFFSDIS